LLSKTDCNVITVDWSSLASGSYLRAKRRVPSTGWYVTLMYKFLAKRGLRGANTHCIGHSLGAHICGYSGKNWPGKF